MTFVTSGETQEMKIISLLALALLTGCSTVVPVTVKFPDPPGELYLQSCPNLAKLKDQPKLSEISTTINVNYSSYYECKSKVDDWIIWYSGQKKIYEGK